MRQREGWPSGFLGAAHEPEIWHVTVGIRATNGYCEITVDALREQVARIEVEIGTQVSRLDADICIETEANTTLSTQIADVVLLLNSQRESIETREKAVEERMEPLHDRMQTMTEEFEERTRSLEGEIVLLK